MWKITAATKNEPKREKSTFTQIEAIAYVCGNK